MTVWCMSTWLSTEPRLYFLAPPEVAATSTASEMASPSEPGLFGSCSSAARPAWVRSVGLAYTSAPKFSTPALAFRCKCDDAPVGFLLIADLDHVNFQGNVEEAAGHGQRGPPLAGAGFGGEGPGAGFLVVRRPSISHRRLCSPISSLVNNALFANYWPNSHLIFALMTWLASTPTA